MEEKMKLKEKDQEQPSREEQAGKKPWQAPTLEDVSEKIMAQPYIRFT